MVSSQVIALGNAQRGALFGRSARFPHNVTVARWSTSGPMSNAEQVSERACTSRRNRHSVVALYRKGAVAERPLPLGPGSLPVSEWAVESPISGSRAHVIPENLTLGNLGVSRDFQLLSVRVAAWHRSVNTLIAKPTPAHC